MVDKQFAWHGVPLLANRSLIFISQLSKLTNNVGMALCGYRVAIKAR